MSFGNLVIDGYARVITGSGLALIMGWRIIVLLPVVFGEPGQVQYGQFMLEAQLFFVTIIFVAGLHLAYAGFRSLRKIYLIAKVKE